MFYSHEEEKVWEDIILEVKQVIWSVINGIAKEMSVEDKHDIYQDCIICVWDKLYKRYDKDRGAKWTSFVYHCCSNVVKRRCTQISRKSKIQNHANKVFSDNYWDDKGRYRQRVNDRPWLTDGQNTISAIYEYLKDNPRPFKKESNNDYLWTRLENGDMNQAELTKKLGYRYTSVISMKKLRFIKDLKKSKVGRELKQLLEVA